MKNGSKPFTAVGDHKPIWLYMLVNLKMELKWQKIMNLFHLNASSVTASTADIDSKTALRADWSPIQ